MASIKKDNRTGTYYFVLDLPRDPVSGARKQKKRRGFKTKKEAQAAAAELFNALTKGTHIEETNLTFEDFCRVWLEDYALLGGVKESTVRARRSNVKVLTRYFSKVAIRDITKKMYQNAIKEMKLADLSDSTISGVHGVARMIFKRALEQELLKQDPTEYTRLPRTVQTVADLENRVDLPKFLEKEQLAHFLIIAQEYGLDGDYEAFLTLAYTGMRVGELAVLRETDINSEDHTISITKTYYNEKNIVTDYKLMTPKTKKSTRVIDVEPVVINVLKTYMNANKEFKMLHRRTYYDKGYVIPNKEKHLGYPRIIGQFEYRMKRLLKIAELTESLTPHSLRHTHTSLLAEARVPLEEIMDRLGHQDDTTTRMVYLHVTKTRKKEASQKFGELMQNL